MNWTAKIEQRQNALLLTFYMFIAMTLVVIRNGLDRRAGLDSHVERSLFPVASAPDAMPPQIAQPQTRPPGYRGEADYFDQLYACALALLYVAETVARQLAGMERAIYELMKQADALAKSRRDEDVKIVNQCAPPRQRLDSS